MTKEAFFEKYQDVIFDITRKNDKVLAKRLIVLFKDLSTEGGIIQRTTKNTKVLRKIALVIRFYSKRQSKEIAAFLNKTLDELLDLNANYFKLSAEDYRASFFEDMGFAKDKGIIKDSRLATLLDNTEAEKVVFGAIERMVQEKTEMAKLTKRTLDLLTPLDIKKPSVFVAQNVKKGGFNFFQIQDRLVSGKMAEEVGFYHGIYAGTKKDNTRDFCGARYNRIYTKKVIKSWDSLTWSGKYKANHKCLSDCGGYACRHHWNWISAEVAQEIARKRN